MHIDNCNMGNLKRFGLYDCKTKHKTDDLWICLTENNNSCPYFILYKYEKYCTHSNNVDFENSYVPIKLTDISTRIYLDVKKGVFWED